jgi:nucleoside permease NupC
MERKPLEKVERDYGQDLLHTIVFLMALLAVLWYLKV